MNGHIVHYVKQDTEIILDAGGFHSDVQILMGAVREYFKQFEQEKEGPNYDCFVQVVKDYDISKESINSYNIFFKYKTIMSTQKYKSDPKWISVVKDHKGCGFYVKKIQKYRPYIIMSDRESEEIYIMYVDITNCLRDPELKKELEKEQKELEKELEKEQKEQQQKQRKQEEEIKKTTKTTKTNTKTNPFSLLYNDDDDGP